MRLDSSKPGIIKMDMKRNIEEMIREFPEKPPDTTIKFP
jgi:hypothetical protein